MVYLILFSCKAAPSPKKLQYDFLKWLHTHTFVLSMLIKPHIQTQACCSRLQEMVGPFPWLHSLSIIALTKMPTATQLLMVTELIALENYFSF